jgi:hypothetical protein
VAGESPKRPGYGGRRRQKRWLAAALLTLGLLGLASGEPPPEEENATPDAEVYLVPRSEWSKAAIRPKAVSVYKDLSLSEMSWTSWSAAMAEGVGRGSVNLCEPACADANYFDGPVRVVLSGPEPRCGEMIYTRISVTWIEKAPPGMAPRFDNMIFDPVC